MKSCFYYYLHPEDKAPTWGRRGNEMEQNYMGWDCWWDCCTNLTTEQMLSPASALPSEVYQSLPLPRRWLWSGNKSWQPRQRSTDFPAGHLKTHHAEQQHTTSQTSPGNEWKAATCHTTCSSITWQGSHARASLLTGCLAAQEACCILLLLLQLVQPHPAACHIHTAHCRASPPASSSSGEYMRSFPRREYSREVVGHRCHLHGCALQVQASYHFGKGLLQPGWHPEDSGGGDWDQTQEGDLGRAYAPSSHFWTCSSEVSMESYICTERGDISVIPWTIRTWQKASPKPQWVHISCCRRLWHGTLYYWSLCAIPLGVSSLLCSVSKCNDFFPKYQTDKIRWHSRARLNSSASLDVPK